MVFLPNDRGIAPGVCGAGSDYQPPLQLDQRRQIDAWRTHGHGNANNGIEHPIRNGNDNAGGPHDLKKFGPSLVAPRAVCRLCCQNTGATGNGLPTLARHGQNERAMALNRKNALFAGSDGGGEHWAVIASLIETCKLCDVEPQNYLADIITKIVNDHPNSKIDQLLPWAYPAAPALRDVA
jgi:hypothetical protein